MYSVGKEKRRIKQSMKWFKCNIQIFLYRLKIGKSKYCEENTMFRVPLLEIDYGKNKSKATLAYLELTEYILSPNKKVFLESLNR